MRQGCALDLTGRRGLDVRRVGPLFSFGFAAVDEAIMRHRRVRADAKSCVGFPSGDVWVRFEVDRKTDGMPAPCPTSTKSRK